MSAGSSSDADDVFSSAAGTTVVRLDVPLLDTRWMGKHGRHFSTDSTAEAVAAVPHQEAQSAKTLIEHVSLLDVFSKPHIVRNTGIICTIGIKKINSGYNNTTHTSAIEVILPLLHKWI